MFETAVIRAQTQAPERRAGLLTASVAAHTLAVGALIIASVQSLTLPTRAPNQISAFSPIPVVELPRQKGDEHGSVTVTRQPAQPSRTVTAPANTAPQVIPDQTHAASSPAGPADPNDSGGPGNDQPLGDPNGVDHGLPIAPTTPVTPVADPATTIYRASEVNPPVVVTRVLPEFPRIAQTMHKSGWVIVECVIDSSGHIRDARVTGSSWDVFDKPALDAVQQWMFKPGTLNGQAVNTLFELRVTFTLH
jgi:TonB family protein